MSRPWHTASGIALLTLATLLVAQAVSFAVVWALPSPSAPQMSLAAAIQALDGDQDPVQLGLRRVRQAKVPEGPDVVWLSAVAAEHLQLPRHRVRTVWRRPVDSRAVQVQVIRQGQLLRGDSGHEALGEEALLPGLLWPAFELAVQDVGGDWQVVGADYSELAQWRRQVLLALSGGAFLLAPLAAWLSLRLTRPLRRLAQASANLSLQSSAPLPVQGPREVQVLAEAMNQARHRLHAQTGEVTRMLAAVAHDLRTPLTGLRLRADSAPAEQAARMIDDIQRMTTMIDQVLDYARGELHTAQRLHTALGELVRECTEHAQARGIEIAVQAPLEAWGAVDALLLRRALDNLIDNAARYGGAVEIALSVQHGQAMIDIADRGPGIPQAEKERLIKPFQRMEGSRNRGTGGTGLGLAMAEAAVRQHGGQLLLLDRPGGGLVARLQWPLAAEG